MATASETSGADGSIDNSRDQTTQDFLTGLKEREDLKQQLTEREKELVATKSQNYDLIKKIEALETELSEAKQSNAHRKKSSTSKRPTSPKKTATKPLRPAKRKSPKKSQDLLSPKDAEKSRDDPFDDPEQLYKRIAEKFPEIPLATVLAAETKFVEADVNRDGTIDAEELEKMLDNGKTMFTKQQVLDILKEIDEDNTNTIDFFECLQVLDLLRQNRHSRLPSSIQQNKSTVCSIQ
ncbi:calcium-dependent kinase-like [Paramuricea clavata]|uniref:Calcium-dependent kinase-like n=1 Tax=Paramuricea clavata TaxID=317549 RepID=A0A7D9IUX7_PARCT|nr:calcium-dependent kinase-like [Paramuricea clavata]